MMHLIRNVILCVLFSKICNCKPLHFTQRLMDNEPRNLGNPCGSSSTSQSSRGLAVSLGREALLMGIGQNMLATVGHFNRSMVRYLRLSSSDTYIIQLLFYFPISARHRPSILCWKVGIASAVAQFRLVPAGIPILHCIPT